MGSLEIDPTLLDIETIRAGLASGAMTAEALAAAHIARADLLEPRLRALTFRNHAALDDAKAIDAKLARGEDLGPLAGVPVIVKEAIDMAGFASTAGWAPYAESRAMVPSRDAPVVQRLRKAGAVIIGKSNIPPFSYDDCRTAGSWRGLTVNAAHPASAPGASSSGTAAAIVAGYGVVGLAEETGGSIQNPASAMSLYSVKPTFGLVPNAGVVPIAGSTRDVVGPHARSVRDAAILLDVLAGYHPEDPKTVASIGNVPEGGYTSLLSDSALASARLGTYGPGWRTQSLDEETAALYGAALDRIASRGATIVADPFAGTGFASFRRVDKNGFDERGCESIVYDFAAYLRRLGPGNPKTLAELDAKARKPAFAPDTVLSHWLEHPVSKASLADPDAVPDLSEFLSVRIQHLALFNKTMDAHGLDALVFPQTFRKLPAADGTDAWPATTVDEINIAGVPLVTVPAGAYADGAPFGLVVVGRMWSEAKLLALANDYEQAFGGRVGLAKELMS
ncbi:amidase [Hyaloraphidium curvatum]|nr:amidase [Hyaloraphidium curvatum]